MNAFYDYLASLEPADTAAKGRRQCMKHVLAAMKPRPALRRPFRIALVWVRIFPHKPYTRKPADVRMGKGKGDVAGYVAPVFPGRILIEVDGVSYDIAKEALRLAAQKLPIPTKFVVAHDYDPSQTV